MTFDTAVQRSERISVALRSFRSKCQVNHIFWKILLLLHSPIKKKIVSQHAGMPYWYRTSANAYGTIQSPVILNENLCIYCLSQPRWLWLCQHIRIEWRWRQCPLSKVRFYYIYTYIFSIFVQFLSRTNFCVSFFFASQFYTWADRCRSDQLIKKCVK